MNWVEGNYNYCKGCCLVECVDEVLHKSHWIYNIPLHSPGKAREKLR